MKKTDKSRKRMGFSLVEVLMALALVAFAVLTIFGLFASGLESAQDTVTDTQASLFALDLLGALEDMYRDTGAWYIAIKDLSGYPGAVGDCQWIPPLSTNWDSDMLGWIQVPPPGQTYTGIIFFADENQ